MNRHELTDEQWQKIEPYLPKRKDGKGGPLADRRKSEMESFMY
ncbi:hypothetical protein [Polycladospora coralii]|nr:hypothetical protein [Polycladospora coralii]